MMAAYSVPGAWYVIVPAHLPVGLGRHLRIDAPPGSTSVSACVEIASDSTT